MTVGADIVCSLLIDQMNDKGILERSIDVRGMPKRTTSYIYTYLGSSTTGAAPMCLQFSFWNVSMSQLYQIGVQRTLQCRIELEIRHVLFVYDESRACGGPLPIWQMLTVPCKALTATYTPQLIRFNPCHG